MTEMALVSADTDHASRALRRVARIAVLAVALGFAMQGLILAVKLTGGQPAASRIVIDVAGGVTWALLVCVGVGIATAIANGRPLLTGLLSFFFAPIALAVTKGFQKALAGWLGAAESQAVLSLGTIGVLRGVEYGFLGWLLGRLVLMDHSRLRPYLLAGSTIGLGFGGGITALTWWTAAGNGAPMAISALVTTLINEVAFPIGCALVIYLGQDVGRNLKIAQAEPAA